MVLEGTFWGGAPVAKKSKGRKMLSEKTQVGCVTGLQVEEQFQVKGFPMNEPQFPALASRGQAGL